MTSQPHNRSVPPAAFAVVAVAIAVAHVLLTRPVGLEGIAVSDGLAIEPGSVIPDGAPVEPGDLIVAVDEREVHGREAYVRALLGVVDSSATVRVRRAVRATTLLLTEERLEGEIPLELQGEFHVARLDGNAVTGEIGLDELRYWVGRSAPAPLEVELAISGQFVEGSVRVVRSAPSLPGLLALGAALLTGFMAVSARNRVRGRVAESRVAALAVLGGAAAASAVFASVVSEDLAPSLVLWVLALAVVGKAASLWLHVSLRRIRPPGLDTAALIFGPATIGVLACLTLGVGAMAGMPAETWLEQQRVLAPVVTCVIAALHVADSVLHLRPVARTPLAFRAALWAGNAVLAVGVLAAVPNPWGMLDGGLSWLVLGLAVAQWWGDFAHLVAVAPRAPDSASFGAGDEGIGAFLIGAQAQVRSGRAAILAGVAERFVFLEPAAPDSGVGGGALIRTLASQPLSAGMSILATEGGIYPRPTGGGEPGHEDPLAGMLERVGVHAAMPLGQRDEGALLSVYLVLRPLPDDPGETAPAWDEAGLIAWMDEVATPLLYAEIAAAVASLLVDAAGRRAPWEGRAEVGESERAAGGLAESPTLPMSIDAGEGTSESGPTGGARLRRTARTGSAEAVPGSERALVLPRARVQAAAGPASGAEAAGDRRSGLARARWTESQAAREYPFDDPDLLTPREWAALDFLITSAGPALFVGEAGIGKEFVARAVHSRSSRGELPLVVLDCAITPSSLVEHVLFGDDEGPGLVELAGDGGLFVKSLGALDPEIGAAVGAKLRAARCRVMWAERYRGPEGGVPSSVPEWMRQAAEDRFLHLTPLRDRPEDVERFASWYLLAAAMRYGRSATELDTEALEWLRCHDLPANFRDIRSLMCDAALRAEGARATVGDVAGRFASISAVPVDPAAQAAADEAERAALIDALDRAGGNKSEAARLLGVSRGKLLRSMKKFSLA